MNKCIISIPQKNNEFCPKSKAQSIASINTHWPIRFKDSMAMHVRWSNSHAKTHIAQKQWSPLSYGKKVHKKRILEVLLRAELRTESDKRLQLECKRWTTLSCPRLWANKAANRPFCRAILPILVLRQLLSLNRCLHQAIQPPQQLFILIQATTRAAFIARTRTKGMARKVRTTRMCPNLILRKLKVFVMTGSLVFLSAMLMEMLQKRTGLKSTAAVLKASWITGFNKKNICGYRQELFEHGGGFKDEARGKYQRACQ